MADLGLFEFDDDEEGESVQYFGFSPPAFVFVVDCSPGMLKNGMLKSLQIIRNGIRNYIFNSTTCYCSIVLMATNKSCNPVNAKHVFVVSQLKPVGVDTIKIVDQLSKLIAEDKFKAEYDFGEFCLPDALWISSTLLFELKRKVEKNIVLFTNRETPFKNAQDRVRTFSKVADLEKFKILFSLFPCKENFERKSYEEIIKIGALQFVDENFIEVKPKHVPLANVPFYISEDFFVPTTINNITKQVKLPFEKSHSKASNAPVTSKITRVRNDNETVPEIQNTLRSENVGDKEVRFTIAEDNEINTSGEKRLKLLGFKPRSMISLELHVQPSAFILPNENAAAGASQFFAALVERCLVKDVVAICTFCPRPTSTVRYVALAPQTAVSPENDSKILPIGFLMIPLPFADEIRQVPESESKSSASQLQVDVMKDVVKKLKFNFDPAHFPNPKLATYWTATEAIALDLNRPEPALDYSVPNVDQQQQRLASLKHDLDESGLGYENNAHSSRPPKKKIDPTSVKEIALVEQYHRNDTLMKLNVDQLKNYLRHVGIAQSVSKMKKSDLVEKVMEYLNKRL